MSGLRVVLVGVLLAGLLVVSPILPLATLLPSSHLTAPYSRTSAAPYAPGAGTVAPTREQVVRPSSAQQYALTFNESGLPSGITWNVSVELAQLRPSAIPVGTSPQELALDTSNGTLYVSNMISNSITAVNVTSGRAVGNVSSPGPLGLTFDAVNGRLYATNPNTNDVSVINLTAGTTIASISVGSFPNNAALDTANGDLYVANANSGNVTVISTATNMVVASIPIGSQPGLAAFDSANDFVYVADQASDNVSVINTSTNLVTAAIATDGNPLDVVVDPSAGLVYVTNTVSNDLQVFNASNYSRLATIAVGADPRRVTLDPSLDMVVVSNAGSNNITVVNASTDTVEFSAATGVAPKGELVDPADGLLYVACGASDNVTVVNLSAHPTVQSDLSTNAGGSITFLEPNGSYVFSVGRTGPFVPTPSSGVVNVSGGSIPVNVTFAASSFGVHFLAQGLPNATDWWVNISGGPSLNSNSTTITTSLVNGSYNFTVASANKSFSAVGGEIVVNGTAVALTIVFTLVTYFVTFTETGLPNGTSWSIDFANGSSFTYSTTSDQIVVALPDGTYLVHAVPSDTAYEPTGRGFNVSGAAQSIGFAFSPTLYEVLFSETGLPSGTNWTVSVNGVGQTTGGTFLIFQEPNGSLSYEVGAVPGYFASPSTATLTLAGGAPALTIVFTPNGDRTYPVTFDESGLPAGTVWDILLNEGLASSTSTAIEFNESNGTYAFSASSINREFPACPANGTVTVVGAGVTSSVVFSTTSVERCTVSFTETGLPAGTEWWVNGSGIGSHGGNGSTISFSAWNGTYSYSLGSANRSWAAASGSFSVQGTPTPVAVTFQLVTYRVTFTETGLPSGTEWWVNGSVIGTHSSTGTTIGFSGANGTYSYTLGSADRTWAASSGSFPLDGAPESVPITFRPYTYTVTFGEEGLPFGTNWSVIVDGATYTSTGSTVSLADPNGTYTFQIGTVSGYSSNLSSGTVSVDGANVVRSLNYAPAPSPATFLGLPVAQGYGLVAGFALLVVAAVLTTALVARRRWAMAPASPSPIRGPPRPPPGNG